METISQWYHAYCKFLDDYGDKRVDYLPLLSSPIPMILILAVWFWFIKSLGPRMMRDRPAYNLDKIIILYNMVQVAVCLIVSYRAFPTMHWNLICARYDFKENVLLAWSGYYYFLLKVADLFDTVFFVLRKKFNQITVLHVFHHSTMVYSSWILVRFFCSGHTPFIGFVNSLVHVVMYSYYTLMIVNKSYRKNVWFKKYITQLQLIQFGIFFLLFTPMLFMPSCSYPKGLALFISVQNGIITMLFGNFYYQNYIKKKVPSAKSHHIGANAYAKLITPEGNKI